MASGCAGCVALTLAAESAVAREERKVVTVLFCDLVGFTAKAEQLDPEDVRALLRPYHDRVRAELERHGGTVEKFIGDAVMALFGAPTAHEDDPERAVRAALAIRDFAVEEGTRAAGRRHDRRGARLARRKPVRGGGHGLGRRRQYGRPPPDSRSGQWDPGGRGDVPGDPPGNRLPRGRRGRGEGQGRADRGVGGDVGPLALRCGRHPSRTRRARRARARALDSAGRVRARPPGADSRSSSPSSASRGWARAASSTSSPGSSTPIPSWSPGARAAASPTATASPSGRSRRS